MSFTPQTGLNNPGPRGEEKVVPINGKTPDTAVIDDLLKDEAGASVDPNVVTEIQNMDGFASMIIAWHKHSISDLENLLQIPVGAEVNTTALNDTEVSVTLDGDAHKAFLIGIHIALILVGKLPFQAIEEDVPDAY